MIYSFKWSDFSDISTQIEPMYLGSRHLGSSTFVPLPAFSIEKLIHIRNRYHFKDSIHLMNQALLHPDWMGVHNSYLSLPALISRPTFINLCMYYKNTRKVIFLSRQSIRELLHHRHPISHCDIRRLYTLDILHRFQNPIVFARISANSRPQKYCKWS